MDESLVNGLSVLRPTADSSCMADRVPINFGENLQSSCLFMVSASQILDQCQELRDIILFELLGPVLSDVEDLRVASYGDSSSERPKDWVTLLVKQISSTNSFFEGKQ